VFGWLRRWLEVPWPTFRAVTGPCLPEPEPEPPVPPRMVDRLSDLFCEKEKEGLTVRAVVLSFVDYAELRKQDRDTVGFPLSQPGGFDPDNAGTLWGAQIKLRKNVLSPVLLTGEGGPGVLPLFSMESMEDEGCVIKD